MGVFDDESDRGSYDRLANRVLRGMRGGRPAASRSPISNRRGTKAQESSLDGLKRRMANEIKRTGGKVPDDLVCYVTPGGKRACFKPKGKPKKKGKGKGRR